MSPKTSDQIPDIVDLEEYAARGDQGEAPPPARRYRIRIDGEKHIVEKSSMSGREVLTLAQRIPVEDYVLILRMRGGPGEIITLDEVVDLTRPGVERFVTGRDGDDTFTVTVFAPRSPEPMKFTWPRSTTVGKAAKEAAEAFGYEAGTPGLQKGDDVLNNAHTLEKAGVEHGDELELVDTGGGV